MEMGAHLARRRCECIGGGEDHITCGDLRGADILENARTVIQMTHRGISRVVRVHRTKLSVAIVASVDPVQ